MIDNIVNLKGRRDVKDAADAEQFLTTLESSGEIRRIDSGPMFRFTKAAVLRYRALVCAAKHHM